MSTGGGGWDREASADDWTPAVRIQAVVREYVGEVGDLQDVRVDGKTYTKAKLKTVVQLGENWIMVEWESVL